MLSVFHIVFVFLALSLAVNSPALAEHYTSCNGKVSPRDNTDRSKAINRTGLTVARNAPKAKTVKAAPQLVTEMGKA